MEINGKKIPNVKYWSQKSSTSIWEHIEHPFRQIVATNGKYYTRRYIGPGNNGLPEYADQDEFNSFEEATKKRFTD